MKSRRILFKNSFRTAFKNWTQLVGIIILIIIFSTISGLLLDISSRVVGGRDDLILSSVQHDFLSEEDINKTLKINEKSDIFSNNENLLNEYQIVKGANNQELYNQFVVSALSEKYGFDWSRTEGRTFNEVKINNKSLTIKAISKTGNGLTKKNQASVDKLVISDGKNIDFGSTRQLVVSQNFANYYNILPGEIVRLQSDSIGNSFRVKDDISKNYKDDFNELVKNIPLMGDEAFESSKFNTYMWYQVVGIGTSADFTMPIIDKTTFLPNVATQAIVYVDKSNFGLENVDNLDKTLYSYNKSASKLYVSSNSDREVFFSMKINNDSSFFNEYHSNNKNFIEKINDDFNDLCEYSKSSISFYNYNDWTYQFASRINNFDRTIYAYKIFSNILLIVVLFLTFITIALITKKQVDFVRKQIGTLKAMGYKKRETLNNFIAAPLITSLIGFLIGMGCAFPVDVIVMQIFQKYFSVTISSFSINWWEIIIGSIISYLINLFMVVVSALVIIKEPTLQLLKGSIVKNISQISIAYKKIFKNSKFNKKLKAAIVSSSFGKVIGVIITTLSSSILITMAFLAPKAMLENSTASFSSDKYNTQYLYEQPDYANPLTFYKTYNYNAQEVRDTGNNNDWGYNNNKTGIINIGLSKASTSDNGYTAYPMNDSGSINWSSVIGSLSEGVQSGDYYSYNISKEIRSVSNLFSFQWKDISSDYLNILNDMDYSSSGSGGDALVYKMIKNTLYNQWSDYKTLITEINDILTTENNGEINNALLTSQILKWFYKIYSNTVNLSWNIKIDKDGYNEFDSTLKQNDVLKNYGNTIGKSIFGFDENSFSNAFDTIKNINNQTQIIATFNDQDIKNVSIDSSWNVDDLRKINQSLLLWLTGTIENRPGTALLLTTYSQAPYYVQQNISSAISNDNNYNITFGLIPYDPEYDELGTEVNSTYNDSKNVSQDLKIFGINKDSNLFELTNKFGKNLKNDLFKNNSSDEISIILNQTVIKKTGLNVGDSINLNVLKNIFQKTDSNSNDLVDTNLDDFDGGWLNKKAIDGLSSLTSDSCKNYANNDANSFADIFMDSKNYKVESSKYANYDISITPSEDDSSEGDQISKIRSAYENSDINDKISSISAKFKIVGVADSYGEAKAWVANDEANKMLNYDQTQEWFFNNYFLPQWYNKEALIPESQKHAWEIFSNSSNENDDYVEFNKKITDILNLNTTNTNDYDFSNYNNSGLSFYRYLKLKADEMKQDENYDQNDQWIVLWNFFNYQYPIFNYKNSINKDITDLSVGISTTEKIGDYSLVGLNGGIDDSGKIYDGLANGAISSAFPLTTKKNILSQITDLVNLSIIIFLVIALLSSATIILLVTNLIIDENKEFIATMKIIGYNKKYVLKLIINIYLIPILFMFAIGFIFGWWLFVFILNYISINSTWVIPLHMTWWMPLQILGILAILFTFTFIICYQNIRSISPLIILQN